MIKMEYLRQEIAVKGTSLCWAHGASALPTLPNILRRLHAPRLSPTGRPINILIEELAVEDNDGFEWQQDVNMRADLLCERGWSMDV